MRTCDRCLDGRHARCGDKLRCACACNRRKAAGRAAAPSVGRAATPAKPRPRSDNPGGRPQQYVGDVRERRAAAMRAARARDVDRAAAQAEMADDPSGLTWSTGTRRLFASDLDRLAAVAAGL